MTRESVAAHEACHAASFLEDRIPILHVRIDMKGVSAGEVQLDLHRFTYDRETLEKVLVGTLTGPIFEKAVKIGWPPDLDSWGPRCAMDIASSAQIALGWLNYKSADWHRALWLAERRYQDPEFQDLVGMIAVELLRKGELSGLDCERLYARWLSASALKLTRETD
jgi:hypothetical protein